MNTDRRLIRQTYEASRCRRSTPRQQLEPSRISCWNHTGRPAEVRSIELDSRGGRLVLPWNVAVGDTIHVSLEDHVSQHRTIRARVAWAQPVRFSDAVIAGVAFDEEVSLAA